MATTRRTGAARKQAAPSTTSGAGACATPARACKEEQDDRGGRHRMGTVSPVSCNRSTSRAPAAAQPATPLRCTRRSQQGTAPRTNRRPPPRPTAPPRRARAPRGGATPSRGQAALHVASLDYPRERLTASRNKFAHAPTHTSHTSRCRTNESCSARLTLLVSYRRPRSPAKRFPAYESS